MQFFSASEDSEHLSENYNSDKKKHVTKANHRVLSPGLPQGAPKGPLVPPRGPEGAPGSPQGPLRGPWVPPGGPKGALGSPQGPEGAPGGGALGSLGPEALRAGGLGKHGLAITRSALDRHGLSKGCGLAVFGEAGLGLNQ